MVGARCWIRPLVLESPMYVSEVHLPFTILRSNPNKYRIFVQTWLERHIECFLSLFWQWSTVCWGRADLDMINALTVVWWDPGCLVPDLPPQKNIRVCEDAALPCIAHVAPPPTLLCSALLPWCVVTWLSGADSNSHTRHTCCTDDWSWQMERADQNGLIIRQSIKKEALLSSNVHQTAHF